MNILLTFLIVLLNSCALPPKNNVEDVKISKVDNTKPENWANEYYNSTLLMVKKPIIETSYKEMQAICKGDDFLFNSQYQGEKPAPVYFKKIPITLKTKVKEVS